jgi:hypothetical protein
MTKSGNCVHPFSSFHPCANSWLINPFIIVYFKSLIGIIPEEFPVAFIDETNDTPSLIDQAIY